MPNKAGVSRKIIRVILQLVLVFTVGFLVIRVGAFLIGEPSKEELVREIVKEVILKRPACADTSEAYQELRASGKNIDLISNLHSYGDNNIFVNEKIVVTKKVGSGSLVACGYLSAKAKIGSRPLQLSYENLYIKPGQFGGHIEKSSAIAINEFASSTEMIFSLNNISYKQRRDSSEIERADWSSLLNVSERTEFTIALNTTNKMGLIENISLVYKCWDPDTGRETLDCTIEISK